VKHTSPAAALKHAKKQKFYETWTFLILVCVVVPIVLRSFVFTPFHIPSGSMKSGLLVGDYIFVSKSAYGYSRYSMPLAPRLWEDRIFFEEPARGDVIVFRLPSNPSIDYIKRLVGLPGDTIQVKRGVLFINGKALPREDLGWWEEKDERGRAHRYRQFKETMPEGKSYIVLDDAPNGPLDDTDVYTVPAAHYFFMGDNRDNSQDSRVISMVGYVPAENLVGKAKRVFVSADAPFYIIWKWLANIRTDRFWQAIE
jgi:signal peptidase I